MTEPPVRPPRLRPQHSLRRRVAFTFAAAVALTALALALGAYFITRSVQETDALDKALTQSRFNLFLADSILPAAPEAADYSDLLQALQIRGEFATIIESGSEVYLSGPQVDQALVSTGLAEVVAAGRLGYQTVQLGSEPAIAVGGRVRPDLTMYFFYPQGDRLTSLMRLRTTLLVGGIVLAVLGALGGYWLARRLVAPIGVASAAAERMSWGDLDIRLQEGRDEFGVLAGSFNRMAENLQAKMDDLEAGQARERRFVADVTHELRTPVSALVGEASLLKNKLEASNDTCPPEVRRLAGLVSGDIARLRQLVDDLLEISRLDAKAAETVPEWVDMADFVRRLVDAHGWSQTVTVSSTVEHARAEASVAGYVLLTDKRRVERILVNLIENALHHGSAPVAIDLGRWVSRDGEAVIGVGVTDSGPGIPASHVEHVFDRFYKADPSRSTSPGSGLGLAIARENARLLGGDLVAGNGPAGGAQFVLTLPVRV